MPNDTNELQVIEADNLPVEPATSMLQIIQQAAMSPHVDIEKMERLLAMKEKMDMREAETKFNAAMAKAQAKMQRVSADASNPQTKSKYASYAALDRALRPIYTKEGFAISFDTGETQVADAVRVLAYVTHKAGFTRQYHADIDASGKGARGGDVMTKTHATGSAMSYGMRYLLKLIFNVAVGEDDDDGNAAGQTAPLLTEDQVNTLHAEATEAGVYEGFISWVKKTLRVNSLEQIRADKYKLVKENLDKAINARMKK